MKRVALFLRQKTVQQTTTPKEAVSQFKTGTFKASFLRGLPLNFKNNSLQANLRGAVFAENNYDTASKGVVLFYPERVKQSRQEVPIVFFCDPVQSTRV